ncbi:MAG TPA: LysM peptidoglycan-binding domain-containing protein [Candidatus Limnocylindrales bacterium]|nr:LysM peptidoglycan-binding domain-containing protein [Candidatus Limnocylindrales bacterium]
MRGIVRLLARDRSNGTDRSASGPTRPANARHVHRRAIGAARFLAHVLTPTPRSRERLAHQITAATPTRVRSARRRLYRRQLALRLTSNRTVPLTIGLIVVIAAGASLAPGVAPVGAAQGNQPAAARLVIGGGAAMAGDDVDFAAPDVDSPTSYVDDGTLYKPVAVDTTVQSASSLMQKYTVRSGDTLTGIASRFGVSMMTLWWANHITSKDALHVGQTLIIPPVSGLVYTVKVGDTLDSVAEANKIDPMDIMDTNGLTDVNLIVGQVLVLPGAKGDPIPTPKPTKRPSSSGSGGSGTPRYTGGSWAWPVVGGGNYISQYFHYGHMGVDIAASYGSPVVAARGGTVTKAGWASTGCGYEVTISIGSNLYTTYCHNSRVLVSVGQSVSKGQQIAKIGESGYATGPHCHFAVSVGYPFESGSYFVNPLRYY